MFVGKSTMICAWIIMFLAGRFVADGQRDNSFEVLKPGLCPPVKALDDCEIECAGDGGCNGNRKCCPTNCGGSVCATPVTSLSNWRTWFRLPWKGQDAESMTNVLDKLTDATEQLHRHTINDVSTSEKCTRACVDGEPPKTCYYHFTLENYNVLGGACELCTPTATNAIKSDCQCVEVDGVERGVLTANRMIPGPSIQVCEGDKVVIDVANHMDGMETSIHWHGIFQKGHQYYDGVPGLTQCSIPSGTTFRYQWPAANAGTHFWHAHAGHQKMDGLFGSLIVRQAPDKDPNDNLYDEDLPRHVVLISDWFHEYSLERFPGLLKPGRSGQIPTNVLVNGKGQFTDPKTGKTTDSPLEVFTVKSGRRYRFRLINGFCSVCPANITVESHKLTVIATDGEPVVPVDVNTIVSYAGERYDFVINADQPVDAYWIQLRGIGDCGNGRVQNLAIIRYENGPHKPTSVAPTYHKGLPLGVVLNPIDFVCHTPRKHAICLSQLKNAKAVDARLLQKSADVRYLPYRFYRHSHEEFFKPDKYSSHMIPPSGEPLITLIDGIAFKFPPSPPLSQLKDIPAHQFCNGDEKPGGFGDHGFCTHKIDIALGDIVELVVADEAPARNRSHPFHLHGYAFHVIGMGKLPESNDIGLTGVKDMDWQGLLNRNFDLPPAKDTIPVPQGGYVIIRFRADNPGYWLFHCHFTFHMPIGMGLVVHVGAQDDLPPVPPGFPTCGNFLPPISDNNYGQQSARTSESRTTQEKKKKKKSRWW